MKIFFLDIELGFWLGIATPVFAFKCLKTPLGWHDMAWVKLGLLRFG
jgi:hypothetical protein